MSVGRTIAYIAAAILIFFGVLMIIGATDPQQGMLGWIPVGIILICIGFGLIWLAGRQAKREKTELIQRIELSGDVNLESLTCQNCGGTLSADNIKMLAGAPVVSCPYCNASYQLSEEPKW
jgi:alkyl hydroperoxide reductase subunit AhpF